jgi:hypothetical protein
VGDPRKGCPHDFYARAEMKCLDCLATEREEARAEGYRAGIEAAKQAYMEWATEDRMRKLLDRFDALLAPPAPSSGRREGEPCGVCHGTGDGAPEDHEHAPPCPACRGTGSAPPAPSTAERAQCKHCAGNGGAYITTYDNSRWFRCDACGGSGAEPPAPSSAPPKAPEVHLCPGCGTADWRVIFTYGRCDKCDAPAAPKEE